MEERVEGSGAPLERVRPRVDGGAFRRPPVLPVVSAFMLFAGLLIGFRLAPAPESKPSASPSASAATSSPSAVALATSAPDLPVYQDQSWEVNSYCFDASGSVSVARPDGSCSSFSYRSVAVAPPADGLSLEAALAAVRDRSGMDAGQVVSAQLTNASGYLEPGRDVWVWEIVAENWGGCNTAADDGVSVVDIGCHQSRVVIVDAVTGELILEAGTSGP